MRDRERDRAVTIVTCIGAVMVVAGLIATRFGALATLFGLVVAILGFTGLVYGIALALGFLRLPDDDPPDGTRSRRRPRP